MGVLLTFQELLQKHLSAIVRIVWHFISEKQFLHFKLSSKHSTSLLRAS